MSTDPRFVFRATVPNEPAAVGAQFTAQTVWAPIATVLPLVTSNGVLLTLDG